MKRKVISLVIAFGLFVLVTMPTYAATTADVTVTATPSFIAISDNVASQDFGAVTVSTTPYTSTDYVGITNTSSIQTDITIAVTTDTWSGGVTWTHSDTATAGVDTAGLKSNRGGTWGVGDVIVKYSSPNYIYENCPATTDFDYGIQLIVPTEFGDGVQKSITLRIEAASG